MGWDGIKRFAGDELQRIQNEGLIPIPTGNQAGYAASGYLKSLLGPLGKPLRILKNPDQIAFEDEVIATSFPQGDNLIFNQDVKDKAKYKQLGDQIGNKSFGRVVLEPGANGYVTRDEYDTNMGMRWHLERLKSGTDTHGNPLSRMDTMGSAAGLVHRGLDRLGWTNPNPYGAVADFGSLAPKKPDVVPPAPAPTPAQQYEVKAGDTLSAIARNHGISLADLTAKNTDITDLNSIVIGQKIKL